MKIEVLTNFKCASVIAPFIQNSEWDGELWITLVEIKFRVWHDSNTAGGLQQRLLNVEYIDYTIKAGFVTNFGSIPSIARWSLNPMGKPLISYAIHDFMYAKENYFYQSEADRALKDLCLYYNESRWNSNKIYAGVWIGGWTSFHKKTSIYKPVSREVIEHICKSNNLKLAA